MDARDIEQMMRRVVREELAALLSGGALPEPAPVPRVVPPAPADRVHPFLLTDPELKQAEGLLPEAERPILRTRVMAARLEQKGQHASASRMRRQADRMEKQLEGRRGRH